MLESPHQFSEGIFGCPSISHKKASSKLKETGEERRIQNPAQDFNQKGTAGNRI
jgi:hypothetical protein